MRNTKRVDVDDHACSSKQGPADADEGKDKETRFSAQSLETSKSELAESRSKVVNEHVSRADSHFRRQRVALARPEPTAKISG